MALSLHHSPQWSRKLNGGGRGTWNSLALVPQPLPLDSSPGLRYFHKDLECGNPIPPPMAVLHLQRGAQVDPCGWRSVLTQQS